MLTVASMRTSVVACAVLASACRGRSEPAFVRLAEARRLVTQMRVDLSKASDASDRAVLADTDEQSVDFAGQARAALDAVGVALAPLADRVSGSDAGRLAQFRQELDRYRKLDGEILALAVENTNLKAQRLSFGPVRQAASDLAVTLDRAAKVTPPARRCRVQELVARAELAVAAIQVLQAPHIAEPSDAEMTRLEHEMAAQQPNARAALDDLSTAGGPAIDADLQAARKALDHFDELSRELIALSRQNTNVRSLRLAIHDKPPLTAACDASLAWLEEALTKEGFSGTR